MADREEELSATQEIQHQQQDSPTADNDQLAEWRVVELRAWLFGFYIPLCGLSFWTGKSTVPSVSTTPGFKRLGLSALWAFSLWVAFNVLGEAIRQVQWMQRFDFYSYDESPSVRSVDWWQTVFVKDVHFAGTIPDPAGWNFYLFKDSVPQMIEKELARHLATASNPYMTFVSQLGRPLVVNASWSEELPTQSPEGRPVSYQLQVVVNGMLIKNLDLTAIASAGVHSFAFSLMDLRPQTPIQINLKMSVGNPWENANATKLPAVLLRATGTEYDLSGAEWKCEAPHTFCGNGIIAFGRPARLVGQYNGQYNRDKPIPGYPGNAMSYNDIKGTLRVWPCVLLFGSIISFILISFIALIARLFYNASIFAPLRKVMVSAAGRLRRLVARRHHQDPSIDDDEERAVRQPLLAPESGSATEDQSLLA